MAELTRERIATLYAEEDAPTGYTIARILHERYELVGSGANYRILYTVALATEKGVS